MTQMAISYGSVLYELQVDEESIRAVRDMLKQTPQLSVVLGNPTIAQKKKHTIIEKVFPECMHNFCKHICDHQHFDEIAEIFVAYEEYKARKQGIVRAKIQYVIPPTKEQQERIQSFLQKKYHGNQVQLMLEKTPELLGGFVIRVGNYEYDRSLRGRLVQMKQKWNGGNNGNH